MSKFDAQSGQDLGIEIWRIEKLDPVRWPREQFGHFFSGDCYIVLHTYEKKGTREQDLFFWLGKDSSQDERGAVAYQTVTLDDQLGGKPVQHREVQGHESAQFVALFDNLQYLEGGVDSAFNKVDRDVYQTRLFQVKGKRHTRVQQVQLAAESLNRGDVFILDLGLTLYQWNGAEANKYEKFKALEVVTKINNDERGAKAEVVVLEDGKDDNDEAFWEALGGGGKAAVKSAEEGGSDDIKPTPPKVVTLAGETVAEGKLQKDVLSTEGVFLVDAGTAVFTWIGRGADKEERAKAMQRGADYLASAGKPDWTPLTRVVEGAETPMFKNLFVQWDPIRTVDVSTPAAKKEKTVANVSEMFQRRQDAEEKMADDGSGSVKVWRIEDFQKVPVPENQVGQFFAGDSYIVLYTYLKSNREHYIIYFWQGRDSSSDEKATSALLAVDMDDQLNGAAVQVRVVQGKEPNHFLTLFKGRMVVHSGGRASAFKNRADSDSYDVDGVSLYHVRGTNSVNTRAVAVAEVAASLNSGDVFVLLTPGTMYVWNGKGANDDERQVGASVAELLKGERELVSVEEGDEPAPFWEAIGGQGEYASTQALGAGEHDPRLFQMSDASGEFTFDEIYNFSQDDLVQEDVMLLDAYDEVFVWIGHGSNQDERRLALKTALDYVANAPDGRDADTPVFKVEAGEEPPNFTCHFLGWSDEQANDFEDPYLKKLQASGASTGAAAAPPLKKQASATRITAESEELAGPNYNTKYSLEQLQNKEVDVDMANRHKYLSDADFQSVFGMTLAEFDQMPAWKQKAAKKKHNLF